MHDKYESREFWPFECLRCLHVWEGDYFVRRQIDGHGNDVEIWLTSGVIVQPPWSGTNCPACGAFHVTSFPPGYLQRHPELMAAPEPAPLASVAAKPIKDIELRAGHPLRPRRLLIAASVPLALFLGYELYANLVQPYIHQH
ncbi:hypothetical protein [Nonomuraea dietziae]|uniref:hypothetical protein n=1 Tax=Nonomuraea dietziae TaxID=65515 RepID=UPI0033DAA90B